MITMSPLVNSLEGCAHDVVSRRSLLSEFGFAVRTVPLRTSSGRLLQADALKMEPFLLALMHHIQRLALRRILASSG